MLMMARWTVCLLGLFSQFGATANPDAQMWLFVDRGPKWQSGPAGSEYHTAFGTITVLTSGGGVLRLSCQLYRDSGKAPLSIDLKAGYAVSVGRWSLKDNRSLEVKLHLVAAEKLAAPDGNALRIPGPDRVESWNMIGGASPSDARRLATPFGQLEPLSAIKNREELNRLVNQYLR